MTSTLSRPRALSVTQLNERVHGLLEESFSDVWVEGEVSDPRTFPSGHTYFTLKDAESQISAVLFKGAASALRFKLEHGLEVLARGRVTTYVKRGQVQLVVSHVEPLAAGALQLAFEQLKKKLSAEGLFDESRKKPLPKFPERIGVVTSVQGAALRDILSVLRRRFHGLHVRVYPVPVQGEGAPGKIVEAIHDFNRLLPDTDVLLIGRGGGSLEDLWAFNEESVARAIHASRIPTVSCVGHETDFTIADFVADLRAPTPSAAAELVVPDKDALRANASEAAERMRACLRSALKSAAGRLEALKKSPLLLRPNRIVEDRALRVDELAGRLAPGLRGLLKRLAERFGLLRVSTTLTDPARICLRPAGRLTELASRLAAPARHAIERAGRELSAKLGQLDALSPLGVLSRGYAIASEGSTGKILRDTSNLRLGDRVHVRLRRGAFSADVAELERK